MIKQYLIYQLIVPVYRSWKVLVMKFPDMMYLFKCVNKIFCYTLTTIFFLNLSMYSSQGQNFVFKKSWFVGYIETAA